MINPVSLGFLHGNKLTNMAFGRHPPLRSRPSAAGLVDGRSSLVSMSMSSTQDARRNTDINTPILPKTFLFGMIFKHPESMAPAVILIIRGPVGGGRNIFYP